VKKKKLNQQKLKMNEAFKLCLV